MTNYEWLLQMGGEERQAWFDAEHVDAHSKAQSKDAPTLSEQSESLSDKADSREKLEADIDDYLESEYGIVPGVVAMIPEWLDRQAAITANGLVSLSVDEESPIKGENATAKGDMRDFDDTREKLEEDVHAIANNTYWESMVIGWLNRQVAITERETKLRELYKFEENHRYHIRSIEEVNQKLNKRIAELTAERDALARDLAECDENRIEFKDQRDHAEEMLAQMERERDYWKLHTDWWAAKYRDMRTSRDCFKERAKRNEGKAKNYQRQLSKAERYGTIWPRYGDGAPMEVGDEAVGHYGKSEITSVKFHGNDVFIGFKWAGKPDGFTTDAKRVGRPPLIASDGKPILKGETLYGLSDSKAWTVTGFDRTRPWSVWAENGGGCKCLKPEWLAHEKPADGARAEKMAALEAENAELREKLGEAIGHAHEIGKLVDLEARAG